jgi:hypothetical protein
MDPSLEPFEALIGTWATEATHPQLGTVVPGSTTFEWLDGGHFLVESRGVRRTYGVSLEGGVVRIWRDDPAFPQRFSGTLEHDTFEGRWQVADTPGDWQDDLRVTYRRGDYSGGGSQL